ncbi:GvpL/GvpF family gas vesicle protein [Amycolatopsis sp. K13G38]|uniref:GvpL/GvpF family gas vesicle protein n=1 Tax=Amycolatopsis acididurans TaxID=2724524 RepID=A0ABX1J0C3_9PSEU|nr:GvpL/GvpF family gas vesicle protein [Amycolatopsis acididurans]NKQ52841.1 GvpL/GvpF family gas vesicle protein [Amycolatopsis acididurans]
MSEDRGIWLYTVTGRPVSTPPHGVSGEMPRLVEAAGLVAVVGDVPLDGFGEDALYRNLEDLDWLSGVARAHDAVIATVAADGPVVPIRLATVYRDDDRVRAMLEQRAADFHRALRRVTGRTEWGVKMFAVPRPEPDPAEAGSSRRGAGTAYLARRRAALAWREEHEQHMAEQADRVHLGLATLAAATRAHPLQNRALAGEHARMVRNLAYLVDDKLKQVFTEAVTACEESNDAIHIQLTGPWPPYSFAALEDQ